MALPTSYTDTELKEFMERVLGDTAHKLGWTAEDGDFDEALNEVLLVCGKADLTFVDTQAEVKKVRIVARMEAWRQAMANTVHAASHSAGAPGTGQVTLSDIHRQAKAQFEMARGEFTENYPELAGLDSQEVQQYTVAYTGDYYANRGD
jgi:hypothetical protein